tara:strand:+ start:5691 stop:6386 length:696 start_codon:yes stop_codon:yes gene_type:complete
MKGYDLIIPVFNEKKIIELLDYIFDISKKFLNIYICYDQDDDISIKLIKQSKYNKSSKISLIKNTKQGPCEAIKTGIAKSMADCLIIYPADDYSNGSLLDKMHDLHLKGYDIVCPSRFTKGGIIKNCPLIKLLIVRCVSFIIFYFSNIKIKDSTNGFRLFSKKILNRYKIESTMGFAYSMELLIKSKMDNYKIIEIPSVWIERNDRKSNFKILKWSKDYLKWFFIAIFKFI